MGRFEAAGILAFSPVAEDRLRRWNFALFPVMAKKLQDNIQRRARGFASTRSIYRPLDLFVAGKSGWRFVAKDAVAFAPWFQMGIPLARLSPWLALSGWPFLGLTGCVIQPCFEAIVGGANLFRAAAVVPKSRRSPSRSFPVAYYYRDLYGRIARARFAVLLRHLHPPYSSHCVWRWENVCARYRALCCGGRFLAGVRPWPSCGFVPECLDHMERNAAADQSTSRWGAASFVVTLNDRVAIFSGEPKGPETLCQTALVSE